MPQVGINSAVVNRVVDADTLAVKIDLGFNLSLDATVQLLGVNAPEPHQVYGPEAKAFVEELVADGSPVTVQASKRDDFGRWLCIVRFGEESLGEMLINRGWARSVK